MKVTGLGLMNAPQEDLYLKVDLKASKRPGGQTALSLLGKIENFSSNSITNLKEFSTRTLPDGFVLDGFFLGTFEFDSLTGHPGIRY